MNLLRRHPWIPLALLAVAGAVASLTMVVIASRHPVEAEPTPTPVGDPR